MSAELIKYAFVAGEVSPTYVGRSDLEQYDFGLALAKNWFVDYRGGLSTRPGQEFCDYMKYPGLVSKFMTFEYSPDLSNTYIILFEHNLIRFVQDGGYVLEFGKAIENMTEAGPTTITITGHGFSNGDWVKFAGATGYPFLAGRTFVVANALPNSFQLTTVEGAFVSTATQGPWSGAGFVARIYTIASPYPSTDLEILRGDQTRDNLRLTHPDHPIYNLKRISHNNWTFALESIGNNKPRPTNIAITFSSAGSHGIAVAVTAIDKDGNESLASNVTPVGGGVNYTATAGSAKITWDPVIGAIRYRVYRSAVVETTSLNRGMQLGYIGSTQATEFVDTNIIPDYTRTPPSYYNPFANGAIRGIDVTNGGSGYTLASVLAITGSPNIGAYNLIVNQTSGKVTGVGIISGGSGFVVPGYTISVGTGATLTFDVSPQTGNYPSVSAVFQQRQIYAASYNQPLTIWGSRPGNFANFDISTIVNDGDSYEFDLDSAQVAPIRHLLVVRGGLMAMTQTGIYLLSGGGTDSIVTPTNALAQPQTYTGVSLVPPLKINTDLLYVEGRGTTVRLLAYNEYSRVYSGDDVSILSNHLMTPKAQVSRWTYSENPYKLVHAVRSDGAILSFTIVKEQKVFAWTQNWTKGYYKDVITIQENGIDRVYFAVERLIGGQYRKFLERQDTRTFEKVEDSMCVDSALVLRGNYPNETLNYGAPYLPGQEGEFTRIRLFTDNPYFTNGMVGNIIRGAGGKYEVLSVESTTEVICKIKQMPTIFVPESPDSTAPSTGPGLWSNDVPVTILSGLWHLNGQKVSILGDGNVFPQQTVSGGQITLPSGVTRAAVGLPYACIARTLPPTTQSAVIEARRKRIVGLGIRLSTSRGLELGPSLDQTYPMRERINEQWGEPILLQDGMRYQLLNTEWDEEAQTYLVQYDPLPATVLSFVSDIEVGDDPD